MEVENQAPKGVNREFRRPEASDHVTIRHPYAANCCATATDSWHRLPNNLGVEDGRSIVNRSLITAYRDAASLGSIQTVASAEPGDRAMVGVWATHR